MRKSGVLSEKNFQRDYTTSEKSDTGVKSLTNWPMKSFDTASRFKAFPRNSGISNVVVSQPYERQSLSDILDSVIILSNSGGISEGNDFKERIDVH